MSHIHPRGDLGCPDDEPQSVTIVQRQCEWSQLSRHHPPFQVQSGGGDPNKISTQSSPIVSKKAPSYSSLCQQGRSHFHCQRDRGAPFAAKELQLSQTNTRFAEWLHPPPATQQLSRAPAGAKITHCLQQPRRKGKARHYTHLYPRHFSLKEPIPSQLVLIASIGHPHLSQLVIAEPKPECHVLLRALGAQHGPGRSKPLPPATEIPFVHSPWGGLRTGQEPCPGAAPLDGRLQWEQNQAQSKAGVEALNVCCCPRLCCPLFLELQQGSWTMFPHQRRTVSQGSWDNGPNGASARKAFIGLPSRMWLTFPLCISPEDTCLNKNPAAKVMLEIFWAILTHNTVLKSP